MFRSSNASHNERPSRKYITPLQGIHGGVVEQRPREVEKVWSAARALWKDGPLIM